MCFCYCFTAVYVEAVNNVNISIFSDECNHCNDIIEKYIFPPTKFAKYQRSERNSH